MKVRTDNLIQLKNKQQSLIRENIREAAHSVLPVILIVLILCLVFVPVTTDLLVSFLIGSVFVIIGIGLFTLGADRSMTPIGNEIGTAMTRTAKLPLILITSFVTGFAVTMAEPDLQVLASDVPNINSRVLILSVSAGVGFFMMLCMLRTVKGWKLRTVLIASYIPIFILAFLSEENFLPVAFDAGGVTTGPMTVPFILALGMGVSRIRSDQSAEADSFGLVGLSSAGPILVVLLLGFFYGSDTGRASAMYSDRIALTISDAVTQDMIASNTVAPIASNTAVSNTVASNIICSDVIADAATIKTSQLLHFSAFAPDNVTNSVFFSSESASNIPAFLQYTADYDTAADSVTTGISFEYLSRLPEYLVEMALALLPITIILFLFQIALIRMSKRSLLGILVGLSYTYAGLVLFMTGVNVGFSPMGTVLGTRIAGSPWPWLIIPTVMILGRNVISAEPAVAVLEKQIEEVSAGSIPGNAIRRALQWAVMLAMGCSAIRVLTGISLLYFIVPGYVAAFILSFRIPDIYTSIAFDSGGVASGPMTASFLLPFIMGACESLGGNVLSDAFGVVSLVAMFPILSVEIVGLVYSRKTAAEESPAAYTNSYEKAGNAGAGSTAGRTPEPAVFNDFEIIDLW